MFAREGNGLAPELTSQDPENPGSSLRVLVSAAAGRRLSAFSTLNYCLVGAVLRLASSHGIACALQLEPTQPVTFFWGITNE